MTLKTTTLIKKITDKNKEHICKFCHKKYSNKHSLNQHLKVHDESNSFKCDVCLKVFSHKSLLTRHYRTHTGEKPFACQICNSKFARISSLVRHQAIHSGFRSYKCTIYTVERYFKTKCQLNNHMVYHFELKFACNYCGRKFYTTSNLKTHEKTHLKKIKYFSFRQFSN